MYSEDRDDDDGIEFIIFNLPKESMDPRKSHAERMFAEEHGVLRELTKTDTLVRKGSVFGDDNIPRSSFVWHKFDSRHESTVEKMREAISEVTVKTKGGNIPHWPVFLPIPRIDQEKWTVVEYRFEGSIIPLKYHEEDAMLHLSDIRGRKGYSVYIHGKSLSGLPGMSITIIYHSSNVSDERLRVDLEGVKKWLQYVSFDPSTVSRGVSLLKKMDMSIYDILQFLKINSAAIESFAGRWSRHRMTKQQTKASGIHVMNQLLHSSMAKIKRLKAFDRKANVSAVKITVFSFPMENALKKNAPTEAKNEFRIAQKMYFSYCQARASLLA